MNNWNELVNTIKSMDDAKNISPQQLNENSAAVGAATKKLASKAIPGVGAALSFHDAWTKWKEGDRSGAVLSVLTGAAYGIPVVGTGVGLGMDAYDIYRDINKPQAQPTKENKLSEAEKIANLRNNLDTISEGRVRQLYSIFRDFVPFKYQDKLDDLISAGRRTEPGAIAPAGAPSRTAADISAEAEAKRRAAATAAQADMAARPAPAGGSGSGSGSGRPPANKPGTETRPAPATATGSAGGAGGGGGSPPTMAPPASPPPSGGMGGGSGRSGSAVGKPAEVASDIGTPSSTGGQTFTEPGRTIHRAGPERAAQQSAGTGTSPTGAVATNVAPTGVAAPRGTSTAGAAGAAGTTGGTAGTAGGSGAGRALAAGAAGVATGAGIDALLNRSDTPGARSSDQIDYTQQATDMQGTSMSPEGNYVRPGTKPSDYSVTGGGRPGVSGAAAASTAASTAAPTATTTSAATGSTAAQPRQQSSPTTTTVSIPTDNRVASVEVPRGSGIRRPDTDLAPDIRPTQQGSQLPADFINRTTPQGFRFTPQQEEWLTRSGGNPNRQDPYILYNMARSAGGPLPPVSYFKDPEDQVIARRLGFPGGQQSQVPQTQRPQPQAQPQAQGSQPFSFSPAQEAWLTKGGGNPNRQDPYILQRMVKSAGGPLPPVSYFKDPEDQAVAKRIGFPMNESNNEFTRLKELIKKI